MGYYHLLGLEREPFSTSPDPDFFYESREHRAALMRLMIEVRLRRGLSWIIGDVGTGKTTLSRKLFQMLKEREDIVFHMILDPTYGTEELFLQSLIQIFNIQTPASNILHCKEALKDFLFRKGVEENKTTVLLIDEAQKLNDVSLEVLRVLLNYETNEYKLLQLVLMSQMELLPRLKGIKNLWDRISLRYALNPLDEKETRQMIEFRLKIAGYESALPLFSEQAIAEIYCHTQGYPRQIAMLCHNALRRLVMVSKLTVEASDIQTLIAQDAKIMV